MFDNNLCLRVFNDLLQSWLQSMQINTQNLLQSLLKEDIDSFIKQLGEFLLITLSSKDVSIKTGEFFYHGFMAALFSSLRSQYEIYSNRESGLRFYGTILIPKPKTNNSKMAFLLAYKHVHANEDQEEIAKKALKQIDNKKYISELKQRDYIKKIIK